MSSDPQRQARTAPSVIDGDAFASRRFLVKMLYLVVALALIQIIGFGLGQDRLPADWRRLFLATAFFGVLGYLLYQLTTPLRAHLLGLQQNRYKLGGPVLVRSAQLYAASLARLSGTLAWPALVFVAVTAHWVLRTWLAANGFQLGAPFTPFEWFLWWGSLVVELAAMVFLGPGLVIEVLQARRALNDEVAIHPIVPERRDHRFELIDTERFRAGGHEWSWRELGMNCVVTGQPGSGKTACVLNALLEGLVGTSSRSSLPASGLILDPKGDFRGKIEDLARRYGRAKDLLVIDPNDPQHSARWNPFDSEDDDLTISHRFEVMINLLFGGGGKDSQVWVGMAQKFVRHALALLRATNPHSVPPSMPQVYELATSRVEVHRRIDRVEDPSARVAIEYFLDEWNPLYEEARMSVQLYLLRALDPFRGEPYATLFAGRSTCRISRAVEDGRIFYVHMPVADREGMAKTIATLVKLEYFRQVRKRLDKNRPSFFLCDEFQSFFTTSEEGSDGSDNEFFEVSRQSHHVNVIGTQNIPALKRRLGNAGDAFVTNLLGNCAVKIFLRNTERETNEYGSKLFGDRIVGMPGAALQGGGRRGMSPGGGAFNVQAQYDAVVRPEEFTRLMIPGARSPSGESSKACEAIVHNATSGEIRVERLRWPLHVISARATDRAAR